LPTATDYLAANLPSASEVQGIGKEVAESPVMVLNKGYVLREKGKPDPSERPRGSTSSSLGVYLKSTDNRPDDHCWWCDPENNSGTHQTRNHHFKHCYKWKDRQATMWARVKEATKKGKQKWRVGDLLVDERCSLAVLDFLRSTHVGRTAPPAEENWDSEGSEGGPGEAGEDGAQRGGRSGGASGVRSDPRAPGIGFPWCGIGFLPFVISLVRLSCIISFGERGPPSPLLGAPALGRDGRQD